MIPDLLDDDPFANLSPVAARRSPGHTRPAVRPRPSLPSLHTLAQMHVSLPTKKIRKGTPGARLPHEPWDMDLSAVLSNQTETCFVSRECAASSDETPGDDADMDSLPSLSYTPSEPSSSALSRSSSSASGAMDSHDGPRHDEDDDPLSYHSDFDYYYTQSFSDQSDPESDPDPPPLPGTTPCTSLYDPLANPHTMRSVSVPRQPPAVLGSPDRDDEPPCGDGWRGQQTAPRGVGRYSPRAHDRSSPDYSSSDDDADDHTAYYSLDGTSRSHSRHGGGSDDDVPLAQRVPTALTAQKSIRKQLRDERQQRRLERAKSSRKAADPPLPSRPTEPLSPSAAPARFRKRSMSAAPAPTSTSRPLHVEPFPVEDLTRKLMNLQSTSRVPAPNLSSRRHGHGNGLSRSPSRGRHTDHTTYLQQKPSRAPSQDRPLGSMRSSRRPDGRHSETQRSPTDQTTTPQAGHSTTATTSSRTTRAGRDFSAGHEQHPKSSRVSEDGRKPSATVPRSPADRENDLAPRAVQRPPVPPLPLPISDPTPPQHSSRAPVPVVQQRIFIGDMQRFAMVEIAPPTNARDVIDAVARQGMLDRSGPWMVFEMAQDYGMERPVRDYELLADVSASWNKDKLLNAFVIKQTPLAHLLGRSAIPTSSPTHRGWVEWESKRGKWSKRWMELREHGLWLSKRDTGKDEVFLCSLSNFDAYLVTRKHKSPKAFVFAIKSTDHLSLFENAADYLHVFSCNPKDGDSWMQAILVARSYVLYQERNVLFTKTGEVLSQAKPLTRTRTRKQSVSSRPAQPLVKPVANIAFEPGSLLAKRKEVAQI